MQCLFILWDLGGLWDLLNNIFESWTYTKFILNLNNNVTFRGLNVLVMKFPNWLQLLWVKIFLQRDTTIYVSRIPIMSFGAKEKISTIIITLDLMELWCFCKDRCNFIEPFSMLEAWWWNDSSCVVWNKICNFTLLSDISPT